MTYSMPKKRLSENKGLPLRCRWKNGAIRYRVPIGMEYLWDNKKEVTLGKTAAEAYRALAEREINHPFRDTGSIMDRYSQEVIPTKAEKTQIDNRRQLPIIRAVFGHMNPTDIKPKHIYQYYDKKNAKTSAKREIALLSHVLTKAVEWGCIDKHPFKGQVTLKEPKPRTRYVCDEELETFLEYCNPVLIAYVRIKLLTGLSRIDILHIKMSDIKDDGLHTGRHKTGKKAIFTWTPELRNAIDNALMARKKLSPFLFCNRRGECYYKGGVASSWESLWKRAMDKALKGKLEERFSDHDLRAKVGSDAEDLRRAQEILMHSSAQTTQRHYRRKPTNITPIK